MKRFELPGAGAHGQVSYVPPEEIPNAITYDYLSPDTLPRLPDVDTTQVIAALDALGAAMITEAEGDTRDGDADFPPVYTYWGQFIDHDMTLNTDRNHSSSPFDIRPDDFTPVPPGRVRTELANARSHALDLDSVYAEGPEQTPELYCPGVVGFHCCDTRPGALRIGINSDSPGEVPPPDPSDNCRDLPREENGSGKAIIGDGRNDENLIVAQFHLAFLRFHNAALDSLGDFDRARDHTRLHYQWLVVNDFLRTVADASIVDAVFRSNDTRFNFTGDFMPVEFAAAAYRFGHTMVRAAYDFNENFGRGERLLPTAPFDQIFRFTGNAREPGEQPLGGNEMLPGNWIADWSRLAHRGSRFGDGRPERFSRKIDTHLAEPLGKLRNEGSEEETEQLRRLMRHLAQRNLRRGYLLSVPTGQAVAKLAGELPLSRSQLLHGATNGSRPDLEDALRRDGDLLLEHTPLWFYVLKEAELLGNGNHLGPVGSRIIVETIAGVLRSNEDSFVARNWSPNDSELPGGPDIRSIDDFLRFAGVL